MSAEYRFLRFEVVGITTIAFLIIGILPMLEKTFVSSLLADMNASLAVLAGLFLLSLPLGYGQHQLVVNLHRSPKSKRTVFKVLSDLVEEVEQSYKKGQLLMTLDDLTRSSFLTALLDLCVYSNKTSIHPTVFKRLSDRWSHFYARRAVGKYAPLSSLVLWGVLLFLGYLAGWPFSFELANFFWAAVWWVVVFVLIGRKIDSYSRKVWFEISFLESSIVLAKREEIIDILSKVVIPMIEHPEYVEKGESYLGALYKF